jgi:hypothetical protein
MKLMNFRLGSFRFYHQSQCKKELLFHEHPFMACTGMAMEVEVVRMAPQYKFFQSFFAQNELKLG